MAVRSGIASLLKGVGWRQIHAVPLLPAIGFTMSLFIGNLAFADPEQVDAVKIGVLSGSLVAAVAGYLLLRTTLPAAQSFGSVSTDCLQRHYLLASGALLPRRAAARLSVSVCGRGGTGRRATLRSLWPKGRGSSSLLDRTNPLNINGNPPRGPFSGRLSGALARHLQHSKVSRFRPVPEFAPRL